MIRGRSHRRCRSSASAVFSRPIWIISPRLGPEKPPPTNHSLLGTQRTTVGRVRRTELAKDEWDKIHLKHAALHMSFLVPEG